MTKQSSQISKFILPAIIFCVLIGKIYCFDLPFFWDNVLLISEQGHFFYENKFSSFFLSPKLDAGHPTLFPIYIATWWSLFSKSLLIAHISCIPLIIGILYFSRQLSLSFLNQNWSLVFLILLICDPVFLTLLMTLNTELFLLLGFVMSLYGLKENKQLSIIIGSIILVLSSTRGFICLGALIVTFGFQHIKTFNLKYFKIFVPAICILFVYHLIHYKTFGWALVNPSDQWRSVKEFNSLNGILKNVFGAGLRLNEFGRFIEWPILAFLLFKSKKLIGDQKLILVLAILLFSFFLIVLIPFHIQFGTRYFMPFFIVVHLLLCRLAQDVVFSKKRILIYILALFLVTGHLWKYPSKISQSWDATLKHMPIHKMMEKYISTNTFGESIGTGFPYVRDFKYQFLKEGLPKYHKYDFDKDKYILYSSVINDFKDDEIDDLFDHWEQVYYDEKNGIQLILFERNE